MITRFCKVILLAAVALNVTLVAVNNVTDYGANALFVRHVLSMDTTFPDNRLKWRAIMSPRIQEVAYLLIITVEWLISLLCWMGVFQLGRFMKNSYQFQAHKVLANSGLVLGIVLWLVGFITLGGEWFLMWQSEKWNGQQAAFRMVVVLTLVLIYLNQSDVDELG